MKRDVKLASASRQRILDDHRAIGELLSRIATLDDAKSVTASVEQLLPVLLRHFEEEEQEIDGLHAVIQKRSPEQTQTLLDLKQEHRQLLADTRQLLAAAKAAHGVDARLRTLGVRLREQLAAHETKETTVFMDSIWTDFGEGD